MKNRALVVWALSWAVFFAFTARADTVLDTALAAFQTSLPIPAPAVASAEIQLLEVAPTFLFVREEDRLLQLVKVKVGNNTSRAVTVQLRIERPDGLSTEAALSLKPGPNLAVVKAPDLRQPAPLALVIRGEGKELARYNFTWQPARQWQVYLTQLSHFDWGYTGTQDQVMQSRSRFLDQVIEFSKQTADWPEDSRFRWTVDGSYVLRNYLQDRPDRAAALQELVRSGRLEINAKLGHLCSSTAGYEMLAREVYYSTRELKTALGAETPTAIHTDVPGLTWGDAAILAGAGVHYLLFHPNRSYRGGAVLKQTGVPRPTIGRGRTARGSWYGVRKIPTSRPPS